MATSVRYSVANVGRELPRLSREFCDCFRAVPMDVPHYSEHDNYIAVISKYGSHPCHGHGDPATVFLEDRLSVPLNDTLYEFVEPEWTYNRSAAIRGHVALIQPKLDFVIINGGLWPHHDLPEDVLQEIRAATDKAGITAIYKTTTKAVLVTDPTNSAAVRCCWLQNI
jgi:hypothetical protein